MATHMQGNDYKGTAYDINHIIIYMGAAALLDMTKTTQSMQLATRMAPSRSLLDVFILPSTGQ